jgi:hypothetical protein
MAHPFNAELEEYQYAINHLSPTVPEAVKEEAQKMHDKLAADEAVSEDKVQEAMFKTGMNEYPHRHAFREMTENMRQERLQEMVLDHLEDDVREKVEPHLESGKTLKEFIKSSTFELELEPEQRFQVEHGLLDAQDHLRDELLKAVKEKQNEYDAKVEKWQERAENILEKIDALEELKDVDPNWASEIENKVELFRAGFLVTERDPKLETVEKEIEYWEGVLASDEDETDAQIADEVAAEE